MLVTWPQNQPLSYSDYRYKHLANSLQLHSVCHNGKMDVDLCQFWIMRPFQEYTFGIKWDCPTPAFHFFWKSLLSPFNKDVLECYSVQWENSKNSWHLLLIMYLTYAKTWYPLFHIIPNNHALICLLYYAYFILIFTKFRVLILLPKITQFQT